MEKTYKLFCNECSNLCVIRFEKENLTDSIGRSDGMNVWMVFICPSCDVIWKELVNK